MTFFVPFIGMSSAQIEDELREIKVSIPNI